MKIGSTYFEKYNINMNKYKTLPALVMAIFTSNFYNEEQNIKIMKCNVEKDITSAYLGGSVESYNKNIVKNATH
jgi:hypothetical protein